MQLVIRPDGTLHSIYDELLDWNCLGLVTIRRGSHVEPDSTGRWSVDLSPVDGPRLGPFSHRSSALLAERRWLEEHWLLRPQ